MARLALAAVVGVAVGVFTENPMLGFQAGALAYGLSAGLDPNKKELGPRLQDLKAPTADLGQPIAYLEGAPRLAGCYIWASDKREIATTTTQGGKGGPGVDSTTFTYEIDVLIELAINECAALRRVWSNGKLVWSNADDADDETLAVSASTTSWRDIRFYGGGATQLPDPTYEAAVGVGNAPAYRTRTTVMIEGLNLGGSGQLPVLTFEVLSEADGTDSVAELTRVEQARYYTGGIPAMKLAGFDMLVMNDLGTVEQYAIATDGTATLTNSIPAAGLSLSGSGTTDLSCWIGCVAGFNVYTCFYADGTHATFDCSGLTVGVGNDQLRFSKVGDDVVIGCETSAYGNKLSRFSSSGGFIHTGAALPDEELYHAIGGAFVYVLAKTTDSVYKCDLATLTLQATIAAPVVGTSESSVFCDSSGLLYYMDTGAGGKAWTWNGTSWDVFATGLGAVAIETFTNSAAFSVDGTKIISQQWQNASPVGHAIVRYAVTRTAIVLPSLDQVVRRQCLGTELLTDSDIDVTDISHDVAIADGLVRSMAVSQVSAPRTTIETLLTSYLCVCSEGETIRFFRRGGDPVVTIPFEDLGMSDEGKAEPLPKKRINDIEQAARVSVKYANVLNDSQPGVEQADRLVTRSTAEAVVETALGFTPTEAKRLADANTMDLAVSLLQLGPIALGRKYAALEAGDPFIVTDSDGSTFRVRSTKCTYSGGVYTHELVLDDASAIVSSAETDSGYESSTLLRLLSDTNLAMLDIPILRDADDTLGPYAAVAATGSKWSGAQIDKSTDNATFASVGSLTTQTAIGTATTVLGDFTGGVVFDEMNSVTVDLGPDATLSNYTRDDALSGNVPGYLIGSEIIVALTATLVSPGVYTLSRLLRGRRGTEWAMSGHASNERAVVLQPDGLRKVIDETPDLNAVRYYRGTTIGRTVNAAQAFTDTGVALRPFSPVCLRVLNVGGDLQVTWLRRTRLSTNFNGFVVPLGEADEEYHFEVVDTMSGNTIRSVITTAPEYFYGVSAQAADGITSGSDFFFRVAQISATVGDGYPAVIGATSNVTPQAEIATVTVGGTYASSNPLYVLLGSTTVNYTSTVLDANLAGIATSLGALIDALSDYSAIAVGPVITITGAVSAPFSISAGLVGAAPWSLNLVQTAAAAAIGSSKKFILSLVSVSPIAAGTVFTVRFERGFPGFGDRTITYTFTSLPHQTNDSILFTLASSSPLILGAGGGGVTWIGGIEADLPIGETAWSATATASSPSALFRCDIIDPGSETVAADRPQITDLTVIGSTVGSPVVGNVYRITLGGVNFDYTVGGGDSYATIVAALITAISGATYTASDVTSTYSGNASVRVRANANNVPFTYSGQIIPGSVTLTAVITQPAI